MIFTQVIVPMFAKASVHQLIIAHDEVSIPHVDTVQLSTVQLSTAVQFVCSWVWREI
jgi:hypothetical protein